MVVFFFLAFTFLCFYAPCSSYLCGTFILKLSFPLRQLYLNYHLLKICESSKEPLFPWLTLTIHHCKTKFPTAIMIWGRSLTLEFSISCEHRVLSPGDSVPWVCSEIWHSNPVILLLMVVVIYATPPQQ